MTGQNMPQDATLPDDKAPRRSVVADVAVDFTIMSLPEAALWLVTLPFRLLARLIGGLLSALG
jgi:hypothetical protein